jgi:hypothetical protein
MDFCWDEIYYRGLFNDQIWDHYRVAVWFFNLINDQIKIFF